MLRRLSAFVLVLACALAPVLPAFAAALSSPAERCCCGQECCMPSNCTPAPARASTPGTATVAVVSRATLPRIAVRSAHLLFVFVSSAPAARASSALSFAALVPTASVPLFTEHCSFLL